MGKLGRAVRPDGHSATGDRAAYGHQRDRCAIPLSDANLGIARLDLAASALGAAWSQMTELEQALDDPVAIND